MIGARTKRRVDLWQQLSKKLKSGAVHDVGDVETNSSVVQNDVNGAKEKMQVNDGDNGDNGVLFDLDSSFVKNIEESATEEIKVEVTGKKDGEDSDDDEDDLYGADEEELEQIARLKKKYKDGPRDHGDNNNDPEDEGDAHEDDLDEDQVEKGANASVEGDDVFLLKAGKSFGNNNRETDTDKESIDNDVNNEPVKDENVVTENVVRDLIHSRLHEEQVNMNRDLLSIRGHNLIPDIHHALESDDSDNQDDDEPPGRVSRLGQDDAKFSSDEDSGEENSSGPDE